jgi:hypothetical protein
MRRHLAGGQEVVLDLEVVLAWEEALLELVPFSVHAVVRVEVDQESARELLVPV